jgi:3-oxoacyl-[acyl-carrier-protein] synthase II
MIGDEIKADLVSILGGFPKCRLTILVATSHGDPGPIGEMSRVTTTFPQSHLDEGIVKSLLMENLVPALLNSIQIQTSATIVSAACASAIVATGYAAERIRSGISDLVVVVALDVLSRVAYSGFNLAGAMSKATCKPFDRNRDGINVAEGAAVFCVASAKAFPKDMQLARIMGFGISCDARHLVEPDVQGLCRALDQAFSLGEVPPTSISAVYWHGTGTVQNDRTEAAVSKLIFGRKVPLGTSTKGSLGHTMGASGGFNVLAACSSLSEFQLPPVAGLEDPEFSDLNLVKGKACDIPEGPILVNALGFGGINAAIILGPLTRNEYTYNS